MLIAVVGKPGRGKTLCAVARAYKAYLRGEQVYSNCHLYFPDFPGAKKPILVTDLSQLQNVSRGTFLGDELWSWADSRRAGSKKNQLISSILLRSRKRGWDVYLTVQDILQLDARIRRMVDVIIRPRLDNRNSPRVCRMEFIDIFGDRVRPSVRFDARKVFPLYDTNEEIRDIGGFETEKLAAKLKEKRIIEKAKKEGVTLSENDY